MKKFMALSLICLFACGKTATVYEGVPVSPAYDPTQGGTVIPETVTDQKTGEVIPVKVNEVKANRDTTKMSVDEKMHNTIEELKAEQHIGFLTKAELVDKYTKNYIQWVKDKQRLETNAGQWIWDKIVESFDYAGQIKHLEESLPIVFGHVLCDGSDRPAYIKAMSYVSAVSVEIIAGVICVASGWGSTVSFLVCMPVGYVAGAALGEFVLGPVIYDLRCQ